MRGRRGSEVPAAAHIARLSDEVVALVERHLLVEDVSELMMAMDIFLMPSLFEGMPVVVIEAQATGLPCVISDKVPAPNFNRTSKGCTTCR